MSDHDVIEETATHRLLVVWDDDPREPYDDGGSPILRFERSYRFDNYDVEQVGGTSFKVPAEIIEALRRFGGEPRPYRRDTETFERYLRIFHGATSVKWHSTGDYNYVTFDTAEWRERMELTDEYMAGLPEHFGPDKPLANMDEYVAYLDGECYGYVIQERETWGRLNNAGELATANHGRRDEWVAVDSCWGFYSLDYVTEAAREEFAHFAGMTVQVQREEG